jgi:hypothetical protein
MAVTTTKTNKPLNPRGNDQSPKGYNRAELYTGKALDFDGVNDEIDLGTQSFITASGFSISTYLNLDDNSEHYIFSTGYSNADSLLFYSAASSTTFGISWYDGSSATLSTAVDYTIGEWFHALITYDGTTLKIYKNGVEVVNEAFAIDNIASGVYEIGWASPRAKSTAYLQGKVSGFKIFNTALTAAQVADLYNNPEKIVPTGVADSALKLWLPMQEGAGTTAYDGSGNGNHGTISGATYVNGVGAPVSQTAVIDWNKSHNYIDKSEEFETASWTENRLVTITDDSFIAPDGSATATEIVENTANDTHFLAQTLSVTAGDYFISVYAKKRDYDFIQISTGGDTSRYANFNISTGATGNANGITDLIIEDAGNGWYRIGGKITTSATSFNYFVTLIQSDVASRFQTYTGTDKGQYIWGAQATKSSTLQPYLRNIGTSAITSDVLLPQGLTSGRDITGVNLFENVRKQGALNLDGNSWAEVHDNASLDFGTGSFRLEAWVKVAFLNQGSSYNAILTLGGSTTADTGLNTRLGSEIRFYYDGSDSKTSVSVGDWVHIVGTYDETNATLYLNGSQVDQDARTAVNITNDSAKQIGRDSNSSRYYQDQIAQPRIYNRALSAEEVERNYTAGKYIYTND